MEVEAAVIEALEAHPGVRRVRLSGSRASGREHELSDWDFVVEASDFESLARDLPALVAPLRPLSQQWDPYSFFDCYMLMLPGPVKLDLQFVDRPREWSPPWEPRADTLEAIDGHFWDWILWLEQKRRGGADDVARESLRNMHRLMLAPMGVETPPESVAEALDRYLEARGALERRFGVVVPRRLQEEVLPALRS